LGALAGAGKTTVFKQLQAACRAKGVMIQCCAATTLAALLFEGATTAHSLFRYPVIEEIDKDPEYTPQCNLDGSQRLNLYLFVQVISSNIASCTGWIETRSHQSMYYVISILV
jgi:hypothetical protein